MARLELKRRMKNLLMFLPNMLHLCGRLMTDRRVPRTEKLLLAGAIIYAVSPLDLIPDMIPFVGQIDDVYLIALTLLRLINRTDARVVREHWRGGGDIIQLAEAVAQVAPRLLPKRVNRVLTSRIESGPGKLSLDSIRSKEASRPLLIEVGRDEAR
ncbi:MAG TPA: YkvA family protein [Pyrinomonadaceae bacterium]|nr:YkvA family protein [Pyrinomonadaceae bacterium]